MRTLSWASACLLMATIAPAAMAQKINACGATFPDPIYKKWFSVYGRSHSGVQINYEANGSGGGVKVMDGTVDFGASDMPMTDQELTAAAKRGERSFTFLPSSGQSCRSIIFQALRRI